VHPGKIAVEHDDVVARGRSVGKGVLAVEGHVDGHPLAAQDGRHRGGKPGVVLHHQHPHRLLLG
jgi:hypothetical protein